MESFDDLPWIDRGPDSVIYQHSYYDVDFKDDPTDVLFCFLNNIDPDILDYELEAAANPPEPEYVYMDPRINVECPDEVIDYSKAGNEVKLFNKFPKKSCMNASQHKITIKYLQNHEKGYELDKSDIAAFHKCEAKRAMEKSTFHEFMKEYCMIYFSEIYKPLEEYTSLYRKEFGRLTNDIHSKDDEQFSIITGLPLPQNISCYEAQVSDIQVVRREGLTRLFSDKLDLEHVAFQKEKYFSEYSNQDSEDLQEDTIVMHEDALVFILAADSELESPSELIFEVKENQSIVFQKPFPSRSISLRTPRAIFKNILDTYHAVPGKIELVNMTKDDIYPHTVEVEEIQSGIEEIPYKPELVEKFLQPVVNEHTTKLMNHVETEFKLKDLKIRLLKDVPFCFNQGNQTLMNFSPKLEYKASFGCEIMSKFELISEWVAQKFLPNSLTCRQRLHAKTFYKVHSTMLSISDIEDELDFRYNIKINVLLGSLNNLLEVISRMPPGKYLLRHSEKAQDKFMAYKKTDDEINAEGKGVISLHSIFREEISNFEFFRKRKFVHINPKICSTVHLNSTTAPCAFPFWITHGTMTPIKNDRTAILKMAKKKEQAKAKLRKAAKNRKKSAKSKAKRAKKAEERKEELEVQQEIANDIKLGIN